MVVIVVAYVITTVLLLLDEIEFSEHIERWEHIYSSVYVAEEDRIADFVRIRNSAFSYSASIVETKFQFHLFRVLC